MIDPRVDYVAAHVEGASADDCVSLATPAPEQSIKHPRRFTKSQLSQRKQQKNLPSQVGALGKQSRTKARTKGKQARGREKGRTRPLPQ